MHLTMVLFSTRLVFAKGSPDLLSTTRRPQISRLVGVVMGQNFQNNVYMKTGVELTNGAVPACTHVAS